MRAYILIGDEMALVLELLGRTDEPAASQLAKSIRSTKLDTAHLLNPAAHPESRAVVQAQLKASEPTLL